LDKRALLFPFVYFVPDFEMRYLRRGTSNISGKAAPALKYSKLRSLEVGAEGLKGLPCLSLTNSAVFFKTVQRRQTPSPSPPPPPRAVLCSHFGCFLRRAPANLWVGPAAPLRGGALENTTMHKTLNPDEYSGIFLPELL